MSAAHVLIHPQPLTEFIAAITRAAGSSEREAELVAGNLVRANLSGHDSHGVGIVPWYVEFIAKQGLLTNQHIKVTGEFGNLVMLDGQRGYGQVIGHEAMQEGIRRAQQGGMALVALRNSHHVGRIGQWAEDCAAVGLVSIHFVNALMRPLVAPYAGADARFTTNPFCVGVPRAGKEPLILDFATSKVALGKVRVAMQAEREMAPGTLIDGRGYPTTDPHVMFEADVAGKLGAILPFGEHKGSGLALICELLGGALSGGKTWTGAATGERKVLNGMFSIIVDPAKMGTGDNLAREMESFVAWHLASPPAAGVDKVKIAGEPEREWKKQRLAEGIPVDPTTWQEIVGAGAKVGLDQAAIEKLAGQGSNG